MQLSRVYAVLAPADDQNDRFGVWAVLQMTVCNLMSSLRCACSGSIQFHFAYRLHAMIGAQSLKSPVFLVQCSASLRSLSPELLFAIHPLHGQSLMVLDGVEGIAVGLCVFVARKPLPHMHGHSGGQRLLLHVRHNGRLPFD